MSVQQLVLQKSFGLDEPSKFSHKIKSNKFAFRSTFGSLASQMIVTVQFNHIGVNAFQFIESTAMFVVKLTFFLGTIGDS